MGWIDPVTKAVVPPIHMASTYQRDEDNGYSSGRIYARADNPTFDQAEATLAALEGGARRLIFSSGMSAATACFLALAPGDHVRGAQGDVLVAAQLAGGLRARTGASKSTSSTPTAPTPSPPPSGRARPSWSGSRRRPTRPGAVTDIAAAADIAHQAPARCSASISTVGTPVLTRPIELGADIVMHSATKYLNGHSDIIAGALVGARDDEHWPKLRADPRPARHHPRPDRGVAAAARHAHAVPARRMGLPLGRDSLAPKFASHPMVGEVLYPGLPPSPDTRRRRSR